MQDLAVAASLALQQLSSTSAPTKETPVFKGMDVEGWLRSIECYFQIDKISEADHLEKVNNFLKAPVAVVSLDRRSHLFSRWQDFKLQTVEQFGASFSGNLMHKFLNIK